MKKLLMIGVLAMASFVACTKTDEIPQTPEAPENPAEELRIVELVTTVAAADDSATKSQWIDGQGISWDADADKNKLGFIDNNNMKGASQVLAIGENGVGIFGLAVSGRLITTWYPFSNENECQRQDDGYAINMAIDNAQTQDGAGVFSMSSIPAISSSVIDLGGDGYFGPSPSNGQFENTMELCAAMVRFLIYSNNAEFRSESVTSVEVVSEDKPLSGRFVATGTWSGDRTIDYANATETNQISSVTLNTPFALTNAVDKMTTDGIYLAVLPVTDAKVSYKVHTKGEDYAAEYSFVPSQGSATRTFAANTICNISLNLSNGSRSQTDLGEEEPEPEAVLVWNAGGMDVTYGGDGNQQGIGLCTNEDIAYGDTKLTPSDVELVVVYEEGSEGDWLHPFFENLSNGNLFVRWDRNPTKETRVGYIYIRWNGIMSEKCVTFRQNAGTGKPYIEPKLTDVYSDKISHKGGTIAAATLTLLADGNPVSVSDFGSYDIALSCYGADACVLEGDKIMITFPENTLTVERSYTLTVAYDADKTGDSATFTQEANDDGEELNTWKYTLSALGEKDIYNGDQIGFGGNVVTGGHWINIDVTGKPNGDAYEGNITNEDAEAILAQAFKFVAPEQADLERYNIVGADTDLELFRLEPQIVGTRIQVLFFLKSENDTGNRRAVKLEIYDIYNSLQCSWVLYQNQK